MRFTVSCFLIASACSAVTWNDTFTATASRSPEDAGTTIADGSTAQQCAGLASMKAPPAITVTFPGHGTPTETVHVVVGAQSCDLHVDTDTDGVVFVSDASPCAALIAVGTPGQSTATVYGTTSPSQLLFQWSYSQGCAIDDVYPLNKQ